VKKSPKFWSAILVLMAGMAWAAGSSGFHQMNFSVEKQFTAGRT